MPVPPERRARTARRIAAFFAPYRGHVAVVVVAILATSLVGLVNPYLLKLLIDDVIVGARYELLLPYVGLMVVLPVVTGLIGVGQTYLNNLIGQRVMEDLRNALYVHLQAMSLRFFAATRTGEIQSRLSNDVGGVQAVVTETAASITANAAVTLSTVVAMVLIDWRLTLLSLGLLPLFLRLTDRVGRIRREVKGETQERLAELSALTEETLSVSGALLAKTFGAQERSIDRFRVLNSSLAALQLRQAMVGRWFFALVGTIFSILPAFVYWLAGSLAAAGDPTAPTAGEIVAFTTLQSRLFSPLGQLLNVRVEVQGSLALFDRIFEYLDLEPGIVDAPDAVDLDPGAARGAVAFEGVAFRYPADAPRTPPARPVGRRGRRGDADPPAAPGGTDGDGEGDVDGRAGGFALRGISFEASPGELVALVGASGAGKTTTTYLIPRLYDPDAGRVTIDGRDVRSIRLASLGRIVGFVTQETYLFHASIRENLRFARPDAGEAELHAATAAAAIADRIAELPQGLDTVVGERGFKLSGGEKQRLAIARVLLKDPRILVLDEATSSLDTVSERLIQAALARLTEGRTTIAIAHRLSTILRADRILVFDRGEIVERGTHAELLAAGGRYARLHREQFGDAPATTAPADAGGPPVNDPAGAPRRGRR